MSMQAKNEELICFGGVNDFHQLISSTDSTEWVKTIQIKLIQIKSIENVEFVFLSGTSNHCSAVSKSGDVYAYGNNECGKLRIDKSCGAVGEFVKINKFSNSKIVDVFAGFNHSLFIDQKGAVYACGNNEFGELLLEKNDSKCVISPLQIFPIKMELLFALLGKI